MFCISRGVGVFIIVTHLIRIHPSHRPAKSNPSRRRTQPRRSNGWGLRAFSFLSRCNRRARSLLWGSRPLLWSWALPGRKMQVGWVELDSRSPEWLKVFWYWYFIIQYCANTHKETRVNHYLAGGPTCKISWIVGVVGPTDNLKLAPSIEIILNLYSLVRISNESHGKATKVNIAKLAKYFFCFCRRRNIASLVDSKCSWLTRVLPFMTKSNGAVSFQHQAVVGWRNRSLVAVGLLTFFRS